MIELKLYIAKFQFPTYRQAYFFMEYSKYKYTQKAYIFDLFVMFCLLNSKYLYQARVSSKKN